MPLDSGARLGPYEIIAPIGAGGMGEVYRAHDPRVGRDVAIKVSNAEFTERFAREARSIAALNHTNICHLYDVGPNYLVMELAEGEDLCGPIELEDALPIISQLIDGIEAAHEKGIIHRDLKPANIKITADDTVKILDFGLAKAADPEPATANPQSSPTVTMRATIAGTILGTAAYMAPEQAKGKTADRRSDIWAFGAVVYELLTGKRAFDGESIGETLAAVLKNEPDWTPVPQGFQKLLRACLEKDPKRRLQSIGDARLLVQESFVRAEEAPTNANRLWIVAASVATLAALLVGFLYFTKPVEEAPILRVSLLPPDKVDLPLNGVPAVSPNGRKIAFAATLEGKTALWVRDLSSPDSRLLPGTEGASLPFWSPDSRHIAFFAGGKLKRTDPEGGPVLPICDASNGRGGTWNQNDLIIFAPSIISALYSVPAAGGTPGAVTILPNGGGAHRYPWFLPDGRHFLYTSYAVNEHDTSTLYVADLQSKTQKMLMHVSSNVLYAAPGYLLFLKETTLMAQPFDARALQITGDAVPLAEKIGYNALDVRGLFSSSQNGVIAYASVSAFATSQLTWFDRAGRAIGTVGAPGVHVSPVISPDGESVAVARRDLETGSLDLWLYNLARNSSSKFTVNSGTNSSPIWSPDGSHIAFYSSVQGPTYIYQKATSGGGREELLDKHSFALVTDDWSRDGRYIIEQVATNGIDLWVLPLFGDRKPFPYLQTPANEARARLSPNGQWLAYVSDESKRNEVYVGAFPAPGSKIQVSSNGGDNPTWSRDGTELFFVSADGKITAVPVKTDPKFEAGIPKPLFDARLGTAGFDVSKDGRFLIPRQTEERGMTPITVMVNWTSLLKR